MNRGDASAEAFELLSAETRHAAAPDTFWIPSAEDRRSVRPGQAVKLLFRFDSSGDAVVERMWVFVRLVGEGRYRGTLQSRPESGGGPEPGTEIEFGPEHIADVATPPEGYEPL